MSVATTTKNDSGPRTMTCPSCGAQDPFPETGSDDGTTTCLRCGHRFPVSDQTNS